jgi:hypothetical protein
VGPMKSECVVCFGKHDPGVHAASLSVRRWLKQRLLRVMAEPPSPPRGATARPNRPLRPIEKNGITRRVPPTGPPAPRPQQRRGRRKV